MPGLPIESMQSKREWGERTALPYWSGASQGMWTPLGVRGQPDRSHCRKRKEKRKGAADGKRTGTVLPNCKTSQGHDISTPTRTHTCARDTAYEPSQRDASCAESECQSGRTVPDPVPERSCAHPPLSTSENARSPHSASAGFEVRNAGSRCSRPCDEVDDGRGAVARSPALRRRDVARLHLKEQAVCGSAAGSERHGEEPAALDWRT
jgi:hypothetical protein